MKSSITIPVKFYFDDNRYDWCMIGGHMKFFLTVMDKLRTRSGEASRIYFDSTPPTQVE